MISMRLQLERGRKMLKISFVVKHSVVQMAGCAKYPKSSSCPDIYAKFQA